MIATALALLGWLLLALVLVVVALVVVPFELRAGGWLTGDSGRGWARLSWAAGAVVVEAALPGGLQVRLAGLRVLRRPLPRPAWWKCCLMTATGWRLPQLAMTGCIRRRAFTRICRW